MTLNLLARLGLAVLLALPAAAHAQDGDRTPTPERNPLRGQAKKADGAVLPAKAPTVEWSEREVAAAKTDCTKILAGLALDYEALPPIKEGKCGAPAPILLKAIGSEPRVEINPPATVTCAMARALSAWLDKTVQPEAKARVGAPVVKLANASSYVCRKRYNGSDTPLSEHALANALDVSEFVFQSGEKVAVLTSWPRFLVEPPPPLAKPTRDDAEITGSIAAAAPRAEPTNAVDVAKSRTVDARTNPFVVPTGVAKVPPPKPPAEATPPGKPADRTGAFVRKVHQDACDSFGTVLGPEANEAHKDHFHFDMKARSRKAFCQ
jgi:hypothetical protein